MKVWIRYGIFGNLRDKEWEEFEVESEEEAEWLAYDLAIGEYESYEGLHGVPTCDDLELDEDASEDEKWSAYQETRESWLRYEYTFEEPEK